MILVLLLSVVAAQVPQLTPTNFQQTLSSNNNVMVYFYSPSCPHCNQLTPKYNKVARQLKEHCLLTKVDGVMYKDLSTKYKVTSFPTLMLFMSGIDIPIVHVGERSEKIITEWALQTINYVLPTQPQPERSQIQFRGQKSSFGYNLTKVFALRDKFRSYYWKEGQPEALTYGKQTTDNFNVSVETDIRREFAKLLPFGQQPWIEMHVGKRDTVYYINKNNSQPILQILNKLAQKYPEMVFSHVQHFDDQYGEVLKYFGIFDEESLVAFRPTTGLTYRLGQPLTEQNTLEFVEEFIGNSSKLVPHRKTERATSPHILTLENVHLLEEIPKDIVLFLFDENDPSTPSILKVIGATIHLLKPNPNIHVFACNLRRNDIILEVAMEPLPKVYFYRHRQKSRPIQFAEEVISPNSVIEFARENTVFDWTFEL